MVNSEALGGRWSVLWTYGLRGRGAGLSWETRVKQACREVMSQSEEPTALHLLVPVVQAQLYADLFCLVAHHVLL